MLEYKGYAGVVEFDSEGKIFTGEVIGIKDVITFQGRDVTELEDSFHKSVDAYLEACAADGVAPEKPYSGKIMVRTDPQLHREAAAKANAARMSLNAWVVQVIEDALHR